KDSAPATVRGDNVGIAFDVEGNSLRTSQTRKVPLDLAARRDPIDRIETRGRWTGHIQIIVKAECEMIGRDTRFQRGKDKDFLAGADRENASGPVSHVQVAIMIESHS